MKEVIYCPRCGELLNRQHLFTSPNGCMKHVNHLVGVYRACLRKTVSHSGGRARGFKHPEETRAKMRGKRGPRKTNVQDDNR